MLLKYLNKKYYLSPSKIQGGGIFSNIFLPKDKIIDLAITWDLGLLPHITKNFGQLINHSWTPNSYLKEIDGKFYVIPKENLPPHTEITLDYRDTPWFVTKPNPNWI